MSVEDQRIYAAKAGVVVHQDDITAPPNKPPSRTVVKLEKEEQAHFANWCWLNGYDGRIWHKTNQASTATPGTPDFIVPVDGTTLYIEFKRPGYQLSEDQVRFAGALERQNILLHVVYSADQAIKLVKSYDTRTEQARSGPLSVRTAPS